MKALEAYDFAFATGAPKAQIQEHVSLGFVERAENIVLLVPLGRVKTHLAVAYSLIETAKGWTVRFTGAADLVIPFETAAHQGRMKEVVHSTAAMPKRLIADEISYLLFGREQANLFCQVVARRYGKGSMTLTSNLAFGSSDEPYAGEQVLTAAMLDRTLHHVTVVQAAGESQRPKNQRRADITARRAAAQTNRSKEDEKVQTSDGWVRFNLSTMARPRSDSRCR